MDEEQYKKLQSELDEYRLKRDEKSDKVLGILTAGKSLGQKPVEYRLTDEVSIFVKSHIPPRVRTELLDAVSKLEKSEDPRDIEIAEEAYYKFMAEMCIDAELKNPEVWREFNEVSGALVQLASFIFKDLSATTEEIERFRRQ